MKGVSACVNGASDVDGEGGVTAFMEANQLEVHADFCKSIDAIEREKDPTILRGEIDIEVFFILTETAGIIGFILGSEAIGVAIQADSEIVGQGDFFVVFRKKAREIDEAFCIFEAPVGIKICGLNRASFC